MKNEHLLQQEANNKYQKYHLLKSSFQSSLQDQDVQRVDVSQSSSVSMYKYQITSQNSRRSKFSTPGTSFHLRKHRSKPLSYACMSHQRKRHSHHVLGLTYPSMLLLKYNIPCILWYSDTHAPFHQTQATCSILTYFHIVPLYPFEFQTSFMHLK